MMNEKIKQFIKENENLINYNEWKEIYQKWFPKGFTEALLNCGINPLKQGLNYVPKWFLSHSNIKEFKIPNSVTSIKNYAFSFCSRLTSIEIPDGVTSISDEVFYNCKSLTSIEIPDSVMSIGQRAFWKCQTLTSVEIPNSVESIGIGAFSGCKSLISVTIPNSMTKIDHSVFYACKSLASVVIPDSVTSIGNYAFCNCSNLTEINYLGTKKEAIGLGIGNKSKKKWREGSAIEKIICADGVIEL